MPVEIYAWLKTSQARQQAIVTLADLAETIAFAEVAKQEPKIASAVRELTIRIQPAVLADAQARAAYVPAMRRALLLATHITDLTLLLPKTTPPAIFFQVLFRDLHTFKTNLPHRALADFLGRHTFLSGLIVGPCGADNGCPLNNIGFAHLITLECESTCIQSIAHNDVVHLAVAHNRPSPPMSITLRSLKTSMFDLYSLTLDFSPGDLDILHCVLHLAPRVQKLKLIEKPTTTSRGGRRSSRRPFHSHLAWFRDLCKLAHLEELALRTSSSLIRHVGDHELERRLVLAWANGVSPRRRTPPLSSSPHPRLYHIRIWYGSTYQASSLSKWSKNGGEWVRLEEPITGVDLRDVDF
ncbi:hypothetical protein C8Q76DRAFT_693969 [Earliella scabrosa]|nr:hypothetical protein C8Q76DRAFT_693969 [Earliella scabrosa]